MTIYNLEDVFVTEGVPQYTFVEPPNYVDILIDVRKPGKPVIIEGQSGTGKTTAIKRHSAGGTGGRELSQRTATC